VYVGLLWVYIGFFSGYVRQATHGFGGWRRQGEKIETPVLVC